MIPKIKDINEVIKHTSKVLTIRKEDAVDDAAQKMSENNVGCLVVVDTQDKLVGVLTERDMLTKILATSNSPSNILVSDIMTTHTISCTMDTSIVEAERLMAENSIRHLPILENGIPISMASSRDIIAYQLRTSSAKKKAAEQLAMLSTNLKSLNIDDVIDLAVNEAPKSFQARNAVLYLKPKDDTDATIYRKGCPTQKDNFYSIENLENASENGRVFLTPDCKNCKEANCKGPSLFIPLTIYDEIEKEDHFNIQGFLCMCHFQPTSVESQDLKLYKASLLQEVLNVNLTNARLYQNYQQARRESEIDPLTGVGTRRVMKKALKAECSRASRYNRHFSLAILDIDKFKEINDTAGHAVGDNALQHVARIMRENIREADVVITRYGGDEFVLLIPETKMDEARILLERLREQIGNISVPGIPKLSISCGLAQWNNSLPPDTPENLLSRADEALYEAKERGRNCVVSSQAVSQTR
ncbi:MAG: diguanylate cyclase [Planctomycetota bacterium]